MATIATRLTNTGNLLVNGTIDEITYAGNTSFASSTVANTVYATGEFDEITINPLASGLARKIYNNGNYHIAGNFDEFTGAPVINSNLTMWVDAGQTASYSGSGTNWVDISNSGSNVSLVNSPTFNSLNAGGAFRFNSSLTQYGTGAGTPVGLTAYTKSIWFNLNSLADNNLISSSVGGHFMFFGGTSKLYSGHTAWAGFPTTYPSTANFSVGVWYNVCLTFDTTNGMTLYINGVQDSVYTAQKTAVSGTGQCNLGCFAPGGNLLNGVIAQAMVYNRVLTADEVSQNYNALRRRFNI